MNEKLRREVMARLVEFMAEAEKRGQEPVGAARTAFPGTPNGVLWEAWSELDYRKENAWWETLEKTIDGEIIERPLTSSAEGRP